MPKINKTSSKDALLIRFREEDTAMSVSRKTLSMMAEKAGVSETALVHMALAALYMKSFAYEGYSLVDPISDDDEAAMEARPATPDVHGDFQNLLQVAQDRISKPA